VLVLENVHKTFVHQAERIEVLRGIDLRVETGARMAIVGASGAGKSTLLHIMGGLEPPTEGRVSFDGRDLQQMDEASLCRFRNREIGFVFQFHHLLPEFNALENTMMPAVIGRYGTREAAGMARRVLEKVGLERRLAHRVGELSGGEQQRVGIARALVMNPRLILADEPSGNLDWLTGKSIADLLVRLSLDEGLAMVIATHNSRLAERMSRQMELTGGQISKRNGA